MNLQSNHHLYDVIGYTPQSNVHKAVGCFDKLSPQGNQAHVLYTPPLHKYLWPILLLLVFTNAYWSSLVYKKTLCWRQSGLR